MNYPSVFGGQAVASNFAYGCPGGPGALVIQQSNPVVALSPVADVSATVAFGYTTTIDGITFYPLSTLAPIMVGSDSNAETVTPDTVGTPLPGYQQVSFTAEFENDHGSGDPIASATFGLQEALNYMGAQGGGIVIIDQNWTKMGGTTTIKNNATLPTGVTIVDNRTTS